VDCGQTEMLVAFSPGPFHADGVAMTGNNNNNVYFFQGTNRIHGQIALNNADRIFRVVDPTINALQFSPNGKRMVAAMYASEIFSIISIDDNSIITVREPLYGAGMINCNWKFEDWIITYSDHGLHMSLWSISNTETQPDRISKPKRCSENLSQFVVGFYSSPICGDLLALAHGDSEMSIFSCSKPGTRWSFNCKWQASEVEYIEWVDPDRILVLRDPLKSGEIVAYRADGVPLQTLDNNFQEFRFDPSHSYLMAWGNERGLCLFHEQKHAGEKRGYLLQTEDKGFLTLQASWNANGSKLAFLVRERNSQIDSQGFVVRRSFPISTDRTADQDMSLATELEQFIGFRWDPTLRDRLIIILKKVVVLWRGGAAPEIIHRIEPEHPMYARLSYSDVQWNSIASKVVMTFSSVPPIVIDINS
jgi:hypothetical protein